MSLSPEKLNTILRQYEAIYAEMNTPNIPQDRLIALSKEYSDLAPIAQEIMSWQKLGTDITQAQELLSDPEMAAMAKEEVERLNAERMQKEHDITLLLLPKDKNDQRNAILEVRAGTGGDEAALFAGDLFRMYERYAHHRGWGFDVLNLAPSEMGGLKEGVASVKGNGVFARLKFESGIHRVQRVPITESSGRIHTSAATVAILPEMSQVEVDIKESDLKIDIYRSSGAGGQHVNTTESAIRITHLPTGLVVTQQGERSQHQNKLNAMRVLATKLRDLMEKKHEQERATERREQVGSGDRSGRIRTYNFPQGRVTDHRINLSVYALTDILEGPGLDLVIDPLILDEQARLLAQFE